MNRAAAELRVLFRAAPARPKLAVAESLSGGSLQARITAISGASEFFLGGVTAYALEQKVNLLGVDRDHAAAVNCVSARVAEEMARGACRLFGADIGIATTGYAEAAPAEGVAVPYAWIAIARRGGDVKSWRVECVGLARVEVQTRVVDAALDALVAMLR
jgi:nicotinamide-nucleotide amidase